MEVDHQVSGPCSNARDPNNPAPAASQGLGKDHLRSSSDSPMEWEDTQPKDAAALPASSCSLPTAGSQSLRLVPPQEWRWGRAEGPLPAKRPRRSPEGFRDTAGRRTRSTSRRLKKRHGRIKM
ncbi:putative UPF0607 protein ENSP00000381418 [Aotus nancymaae]|uniref:putative UPF0607 protein ENSP00000381418 n=1 Tax=Aotus nancymaae TaxID=37293 RepID=UPI0030FEBF2F